MSTDNADKLRMLSTYLSQLDCQREDSTTIEQKTDRKALVQLYEHLPFQYPSLFEELLLNYRWDALDLSLLRVKPNRAGEDLSGFLSEICADEYIHEYCIQNNFLLFGMGPDVSYDPACFQVVPTLHPDSYPVMLIDHEDILCLRKKVRTEVLATNFESLIEMVLERFGLNS